MTKFYQGKIYLLSNDLWDHINVKKIGVAEDTNDRVKTLSTALPTQINILYESSTLIDKFFYEHMLSKLLYKYRYNNHREFYDINIDDFKNIIISIETINKLYDTPELLDAFIHNYDYNYYKNRFSYKHNPVTDNVHIRNKKFYKKTTLSVVT
jgi:hypothetical protein